MPKKSLVQMMSADGVRRPEVADQLDRAVESILKRLRKGEVVSLPGLGKLVPGPKTSFHFEKSQEVRISSRGQR
jgi:nucleoid DNA-binding protein